MTSYTGGRNDRRRPNQDQTKGESKGPFAGDEASDLGERERERERTTDVGLVSAGTRPAARATMRNFGQPELLMSEPCLQKNATSSARLASLPPARPRGVRVERETSGARPQEPAASRASRHGDA